MTPAPVLRDYQIGAVEACERASAAQGDDGCEALVALPTGTGKTIVFAELIRRRGGRALVLAHRDELLGQAEAKLIAAGIPADTIGRVQARQDDVTAPVVLGSVQTLAWTPRRGRLIKAQASAGCFHTVIIDEAHHAPAPSYRAILDDLDADLSVDDRGPLVAGFTATPGRKGMADIFGAPVYSRDLLDMIASGWLCDLRGRRVGLDLDLEALRRSHGDYVEADLVRALGQANAPEAVARAWAEHAADRPTLVFTAGVELAHETAEALRQEGASAEAIDGSMSPETRAPILDRYRDGTTKVIVNVAVLCEGIDLPSTACVVLARPTLSPILYSQQIGRGTRLAPGKIDCLIIDLVGSTDRHDLSRLGTAWAPVGLVERLTGFAVRDGDSLLESALRDERRRERLSSLLGEHGRLVVEDVSLFGRCQLRWLTLPGSTPTYVLGVGDAGHIVLVADGPSTYSVHRLARDDEPERLGESLSLEAATGIAEHVVDVRGGRRLASASAAWRSRPATAKQICYLSSIRRIPSDVAQSLTAGQASDLIDATIAARRVGSLLLAAPFEPAHLFPSVFDEVG